MIVTNKFVMMHVPRCGGTWVRETLCNGALLEPAGYLKIHSVCPREALKGRQLFCFVRHPASWYASYWNRRMCMGWTDCPFDNYKSSNLNEFVHNVLAAEGDYFSRLIRNYTENTTYVGLFENLVSELIQMLEMSNSAYDIAAISRAKPLNCSDYEKYSGVYTPDTLEHLQGVEKYVIDKYYRNADVPVFFVKNRS